MPEVKDMGKLALAIVLGLSTWSVSYADPILIVAFNAENLFDTVDDPNNPRDDTYLPLSVKKQKGKDHDERCARYNKPGFYRKQCKSLNWDDEAYGMKLQRYADVLKAMPQMPDVLVIPETENKRVLEDLTTRHLSAENFRIIQLDTTDGSESRGIDVGILTKLPIVEEPKAFVVDFKRDSGTCGKTRDIVRVGLRLPDGQPLFVFGVHFPSGGSPFRCRIRAFKELNKLAKDLPAGSLAVAAGDFNINCVEGPSDAFARLLWKGNWSASPLVSAGCKAPGSRMHVDRLMYSWHTWSFLDMILVSKDLSPSQPSTKDWFADLGSFSTLVLSQEQVKTDDKDSGYIEPRRFDPVSHHGVSDHFPVGIRLLRRR